MRAYRPGSDERSCELDQSLVEDNLFFLERHSLADCHGTARGMKIDPRDIAPVVAFEMDPQLDWRSSLEARAHGEFVIRCRIEAANDSRLVVGKEYYVLAGVGYEMVNTYDMISTQAISAVAIKLSRRLGAHEAARQDHQPGYCQTDCHVEISV